MLTHRLCLILILAGSLAASEAVLPNGDFEAVDAEGHPRGWTGDWGRHTVETGPQGRFLRMTSDNPQGNLTIGRRLAVDADWKRIRLSMRVRVHELTPGEQGWQNFRFNHRVLDAAGGHIGGYAGIPSVSQTTDGWVTVSEERDLPAGAATIDLSPGFYFATGRVDLDDLAITVVEGVPSLGDAEATVELRPHWDQTPAVAVSPTRGEMILNDCWRFAPARGDAPPDAGWGLFHVPGSWTSQGWPPVTASPSAPGRGPQWEGSLDDHSRMWFRREVAVPADWSGRRFELELELVSTDARILVDGEPVGQVDWPGGVVDLGAAIVPGQRHTLDILVVAVADDKQVAHYMDADDVTLKPAKLASKGILGDVVLRATPRGERIDGIFVQPSVRRGRVDLLVETAGIADGETRRVVARMIDAEGVEAERFSGELAIDAGRGTVGWAWDDPRLWELADPHQYTLELDLLGGAGPVADTFVVRFGFREFHIDGPDFFLNDQRIRLRPVLGHLGSPVLPEQVDQMVGDILGHGFTFKEFWPGRSLDRGSNSLVQQQVFARSASERGLMITAIAPHMGGVLRDDGLSDADRAEVERRFAYTWRHLRNEPAVVMYSTTGNVFGYQMDQDPRLIGRSDHGQYDERQQRRVAMGEELMAGMRTVDPTRPIFTHHGGSAGEVHTLNMYLCLIPIQERIEWLEHYRAKGDMPFMPVEFGTPLHTTWHRGRKGFGPTVHSEPLVTEFAARDFGREAYAMERAAYREMLASKFKQGQDYDNLHGAIDAEPALIHQVALHNGPTWRHWRTWGITGGMIPWANGHGFTRTDDANREIELPPFVPGERGPHANRVRADKIHKLSPPAFALNPAGEALVANNQPTLAWIAGRDGDAEVDRRGFADRSHHYRGGDEITKQLVFINDARAVQPVRFTWRIELGGEALAEGGDDFELGSAEDRLVAIAASLPAVDERSEGAVILEATIGEAVHQDRFVFRVYPQAQRPGTTLAVVDEVGETRAMLEALGYPVEAWDGVTTDRLVVIGRRQLSAHGLVDALQGHVEAGGRAVIMAQDPDWLRQTWGLRVAWHQSRRVHVVDADHPVTAGLDARDLHLWSGHSRLLEPRPDYLATHGWAKAPSSQPYAGWRWGNRHSIASAAIEKPHHAGWRPILECEFDLAYSPLLELDHGAGKLVLCTLDLEDHAPLDPVAETLAHRVFAHAAEAPTVARRETVLLGDDDDAALLASMGLAFERAAALPAEGLAVIGAAAVDDDALRAFLHRGGRALVLARAGSGLLGTQLERREDAVGSLHDPSWPEAAGLSPSDLRWRAEHPAWVLSGGCEIAADGFLGRVVVGDGVALLVQADPRLLPADDRTFFRYTRWRQTRTLAQLLANLGARFENDGAVFKASDRGRIDLSAQPWEAKATLVLPSAPSYGERHQEPGITPAAQAAVAEAAGSAGWERVTMPQAIEAVWEDMDGEAVFRTVVDLTPEQAAVDLQLLLGKIDDFDMTFVNGQEIGRTDDTTPGAWNTERIYTIPAAALKPGANLIAVRIFDHFGGNGGMVGKGRDFALRPAPDAGVIGLYHADYRDDFTFGDDPFRYYRW